MYDGEKQPIWTVKDKDQYHKIKKGKVSLWGEEEELINKI